MIANRLAPMLAFPLLLCGSALAEDASPVAYDPESALAALKTPARRRYLLYLKSQVRAGVVMFTRRSARIVATIVSAVALNFCLASAGLSQTTSADAVTSEGDRTPEEIIVYGKKNIIILRRRCRHLRSETGVRLPHDCVGAGCGLGDEHGGVGPPHVHQRHESVRR